MHALGSTSVKAPAPLRLVLFYPMDKKQRGRRRGRRRIAELEQRSRGDPQRKEGFPALDAAEERSSHLVAGKV